jgi:hypothetical protein
MKRVEHVVCMSQKIHTKCGGGGGGAKIVNKRLKRIIIK